MDRICRISGAVDGVDPFDRLRAGLVDMVDGMDVVDGLGQLQLGGDFRIATPRPNEDFRIPVGGSSFSCR